MAPVKGWRLSKKGKNKKDFLEPDPTKKQFRTDDSNASGWYRRLVSRFRRYRCSTLFKNNCNFPRVALSYKDCSLLWIIADYCRPKRELRFEFKCSYFENFVISNPNIDFLYQELYNTGLLPSLGTKILGLGQFTWWIVLTKKNWVATPVSGGVVGAEGMVTKGANWRSPGTKYKRPKNVFVVTSIALILDRLGTQLLWPLA